MPLKEQLENDNNPPDSPFYRFHKDLFFDTGSGDIWKGPEKIIQIPPGQSRLFQIFLENPNITLPHEWLLRNMYPDEHTLPGQFRFDSRIPSLLSKIRRTLKTIDEELLDKIEAVKGRGVRWLDLDYEVEAIQTEAFHQIRQELLRNAAI